MLLAKHNVKKIDDGDRRKIPELMAANESIPARKIIVINANSSYKDGRNQTNVNSLVTDGFHPQIYSSSITGSASGGTSATTTYP